MGEADWDAVYSVHVDASFALTKAAWPLFVKQKYGRIVMTASAAGIYGNYGQANYSAAKHALYGLAKTLAIEGATKNIYCNVIAPLAASKMTETVMPPEMLQLLKPDYVAPFVVFLSSSQCNENGSLFEIGGGFAAKMRIQRSEGIIMNTSKESFNLAEIESKFEKVFDFSKSKYPNAITDTDWISLAEQSAKQDSPLIDTSLGRNVFKGQVALVTGAGNGLGKAYALYLASNGCAVAVNDFNKQAADAVVAAIKQKGGKAIAIVESVENAKSIVDQVIAAFSRLDILINNAGILRDKSFIKMTEADWHQVQRVHLRSTFLLMKAVFPLMQKQKYGKILNTSSAVGLYGNFGQANYSAAKSGIIGLSKTVAIEGEKHGISVNVIAPNAGTLMTATILPPEVVELLKPEFVAPFAAFLVSPLCKSTGKVFEVGSGWIASVRWERAGGLFMADNLSVNEIVGRWKEVVDFSKPSYPTLASDSLSTILSFAQAKKEKSEPYRYDGKQVILYNLGVGAKATQLHYSYENSLHFQPVMSFSVIPGFSSIMSNSLDDYISDYNPVQCELIDR